MDCKQTDRLIMQYGEKTLKPNDARTLTEHLLICEGCRDSFVAFDICLDETAIIEAPADFADCVLAKITEDRLRAGQKASSLHSQFSRIAIGLVVILSGVLLFFGLSFGITSGFFGAVTEYAVHYGVAVRPFVDGIARSLSASARFGQFTFIFVPVLSVLLFVLHSTEKKAEA